MSSNNLPLNFGGLPSRHSNYKNSRIVIVPVPFDKTSTWIKGSSKGPSAIIHASRHMELYDIETDSEVYRLGIHTAPPVKANRPGVMVSAVYRKVRNLVKNNKFVVILGGEHTVSIGSLKAHAEQFHNMSILHLDAHSDMRTSYEGNRYSHACVMARAKEMTDRIVSVGIRSMDSSELDKRDRDKIILASEVKKSKEWIKNVLKKLTKNVYLTIDLDVFDPSIMPSTGTPEPGGLGWYEVLDLIEGVSDKKHVVGCDVVELCPSEHNRAPDFLAAKLIYKILSFKFAG